MKLSPFTLHRPASAGQASRLLADLGDDAAAYCGGTELLLAMKLGLASYEHLVDLKRVSGLRGIAAADDGGVRIGAATTHYEIETSAALRESYPELPAMISRVANLRVRSAGTLGGNLCFADPHSDPAPFLTAVGATLVCQRDARIRRIPAAAFLTGPYQTALARGELLTAVELPPRPDRTGLCHLRMKLTERPVVTVTALVTLGEAGAVAGARLIVGSVAGVPFGADTGVLVGASPGASAADSPGASPGASPADSPGASSGASAADFAARAQACAEQAAAGCAPLPDGEASPDYLRHLVAVHARRALDEAFAAASAASAAS